MGEPETVTDPSHASDDVAGRLRSKLTAALAPVRLELSDDSHHHVGHAGHDGRGQSHFSLLIVSDAFEGKSRVERQRMVHEAIAEDLAGRVHALSITARARSEIETE